MDTHGFQLPKTVQFGTQGVKFNPPSGDDTMVINGVTQNINTMHFCITAMSEYSHRSLEELRYEDYTLRTEPTHGLFQLSPLLGALDTSISDVSVKNETRAEDDLAAVSNSSTEYVDVCSACDFSGKKVEAKENCSNCNENLCKTCFAHHRAACDNLKKPQPDSICNEECEKHTGRIVEFFCPGHDTVVCSVCISLMHRGCDVTYIPEILEEFANSQELPMLIKDMEALDIQNQNCLQQVENHLEAVEKSDSESVKLIKKFRAEMNAYMDRKRRELFADLKKSKETNTHRMEEVQTGCQRVRQQNEESKEKLTTNKDVAKLFTLTKRAKIQTQNLKKEMAKLEAQNIIKCLHFHARDDLQQIMMSQEQFGVLKASTQRSKKVIVNIEDTDIVDDGKQSVLSLEDRTTASITGLALPSAGFIVMVDNANMAVKLLRTTDMKKLVSRMSLLGNPYGITTIACNEVAITQPDEHKVTFLATDRCLSVLRELPVGGKCCGITFACEVLIITYNDPPKLEILNLQGTVFRVISKDSFGQQLFRNPSSVIVNNNGTEDLVYVYDTDLRTLTSMSFDGKLKNTITDPGLFGPKSLLSIQPGCIATCNCFDITVVSNFGGTLINVKTWSNVRGASVAVCDLDNCKLYVGSTGVVPETRNILHVYKLTVKKTDSSIRNK